jgi:hypothetical protein
MVACSLAAKIADQVLDAADLWMLSIMNCGYKKILGLENS